MSRPARYAVEFTKAAERDLRAVPRDAQRRIVACIQELEFEPRPSGVRKLNTPTVLWRIRVGDWRVVYQINEAAVIVTVVRVKNRRDAYRNL